MPVRGTKPKPPGQAVNRNKPTYDWVEVDNVPFEGGPDLPELRANGEPWRDAVRRKWDAWRTMPHCKLWTATDWEFAFDSIEIAAAVYDGELRMAAELRNREKLLGTTLDFRRDLRIKYIDPVVDEGDGATVTRMDDYRDL